MPLRSATAPHGAADAVLLVAGGVGITPISALASALLADDHAAAAASAKRAAVTAARLPTVSDTPSTERATALLRDESAGDAAAATTTAAAAAAAGPSVHLVWAVRHPSLVLEFLPLLERLCASPRAAVRLHLTGGAADAASLPPWLRAHISDGRPDAEEVLSECGSGGAERVHVCTCGPAPLEAAFRAACARRARDGEGVHLRTLNFAL